GVDVAYRATQDALAYGKVFAQTFDLENWYPERLRLDGNLACVRLPLGRHQRGCRGLNHWLSPRSGLNASKRPNDPAAFPDRAETGRGTCRRRRRTAARTCTPAVDC